MILTAAVAALSVLPMGMSAQGNIHERSTEYEWPADEQVVENLKQWQDLKFGVLLHWGLYAVPGIVESWSICDEDWITRDSTCTYQQYMDWYFGLANEFRPTKFDATQWASACADAGMRYMIFTTKHHDGFCMWDTRETNFSIARHAFKDDARRDVLRHVLDAFREKNFTVGTYFSKPDWHSQQYWWDTYGKKGRNVNYPIKQHPQRWQQFVKYTHRQIEELMSNYGKVDILWLDGGWITGDEVGLNEVLPEARKLNPGMICVDRTIQGPNENYQTPERMVPDHQILHPWESCLPHSNDWGWTPRARYKSARRVINTLAEITAKGGCLVLGVGPTAGGIVEEKEVVILKEIGAWLKANGEAIYATRPVDNYHQDRLWFTRSKDNSKLYAIYALPDGESLPQTISWTGNAPKGKAVLLSTGKKLRTVTKDGVTTVTLPKGLKDDSIALRLEVR